MRTKKISAAQLESLAALADGIDACLFAAKLPLPAAIHIKCLATKLRETRDKIAAVVREVSGDDPWATNPLEG